MKYFVKTPWFVKKMWPSYLWSIKTKEKVIYLSFDDGPHPVATPFVLDLLKKYHAKGTFFCIGKNVLLYPEIYQRILDEGHTTGNHSHNHLNGWQAHTNVYLNDIAEASTVIDSPLFRPPYGKIKPAQAKQVRRVLRNEKAKLVMWSVLSGDFDVGITKEQCIRNVTSNAKPGSIVVFHDSEKAFPLLKETLPAVLEYFSKKSYGFEAISWQPAKKRSKKRK
jgi:peptidoglycan-N-acetylglucosamine deacetylase